MSLPGRKVFVEIAFRALVQTALVSPPGTCERQLRLEIGGGVVSGGYGWCMPQVKDRSGQSILSEQGQGQETSSEVGIRVQGRAGARQAPT